MKKIALPGSERPVPPGTLIGKPSPDERFSVSVILRPRSSNGERFPQRFNHKVLSREEFAAVHGADPQEIARIETFAKESNLAVLGVYPDKRTIELSGKAIDFSRAFQVVLGLYELEGRQFRGHANSIYLPTDLVPLIQGILGLDTRAIFRPALGFTSGVELNSIQDVISAYNFPTGLDGTGQTIGIICLEGGFRQSDLTSFFGTAVPTIIPVSVEGASNKPGPSDREVTFDIEMVGRIAPSATIVTYFVPAGSFINGIRDAVHDTVNQPSIISISFTANESAAIDNDRQLLEQFFQDAADLGITVLAASGDHGSNSDNAGAPGPPGVNLPAACPHVTACGGTVAKIVGGVLNDEVVWNNPALATGGGVSDFFPVPPYQSGASVVPLSLTDPGHIGRGVPDVAGHADSYIGFFFHNTVGLFNGTSAVAPLWAGLIALINQLKGSNQGFLNPALYGRLGPGPRTALNDILRGDNGAYSAGPGWDPCTGWGSPNGGVIADVMGPPTILSVNPALGPVGGGTIVTLQGERFSGALNVSFGAATAPFFSVDNDQQISVLLPGVATDNTVDVQVTTQQGFSATTPNDLFEYFFPIPVVTSVFPSGGSTDGGDPIVIRGLFFTGATTVSFIGPSINETVTVHPDGDGLIALATPRTGSGGTVHVLVTTPGGTSAQTSLDQFTYIAPPAGSFVVLVDPTITAAQFSQLQDSVAFGGGTVEQSIPPLMFLATGPDAVQLALVTTPIVVGLFPVDVAPAIAELLADGVDPAAIASLLSGMIPVAPPAEVLPGGDDEFGSDLTGEDDDFNPVVDRLEPSET